MLWWPWHPWPPWPVGASIQARWHRRTYTSGCQYGVNGCRVEHCGFSAAQRGRAGRWGDDMHSLIDGAQERPRWATEHRSGLGERRSMGVASAGWTCLRRLVWALSGVGEIHRRHGEISELADVSTTWEDERTCRRSGGAERRASNETISGSTDRGYGYEFLLPGCIVATQLGP